MPRPGTLSRAATALAVAASLLLASAVSSAAEPSPKPSVPDPDGSGRILVTFQRSVKADQVRNAHAAAKGRSIRRIAALRTEVVEVDDVAAALSAYGARSDVEWVGRDGVVEAFTHVLDNQFAPKQWNLQDLSPNNPGTLNWHPVYDPTFGSGVTVAVVDTGVGRTAIPPYDGFRHPVSGYDFVSRDPFPDDENGHGTHIAGTIAQQTGNPETTEPATRWSVAGVAPDARILAVRVLDREGRGSVSATAEGIVYAANEGAKVINLSLGGDFAKPLCDAVNYATARGAMVVAASGNESAAGLVPVAYPAACPGAVAVGGHKWNAQRGSYSNGSCELAFTAPGGDISDDPSSNSNQPLRDPRNGILQEAWNPQATPPRYQFMYDSGTSMAAAHVAGAAAVLMGSPFNKSAGDAARILRATARDIGPAGQDPEYGAGAVDLAGAVQAARTGDVPNLADRLGYWMVASDGGIFSFGDAPFLGSTGNIRLNSPIVAMARTVTGRGYWLVAADGGIFNFGDAPFLGSAGNIPLKAPIVGMAPTATGQGYFLVARDGGIFAYGDARFAGSTGSLRLNSPIVGMTATRTGRGYWLVASDGGIFSFGDAQFYGSTGDIRLNSPIVGISRTPSGAGYWMVATDGGIFAFGDAAFHGSTGNIRLNQPIIGMQPTCFGTGYWLIARDGGVFAFGAAPFLGSTGNIRLNQPIVGAHLAIDQRASQQ
ncbi:MAG TPA: S8 family serine peptidase [Acidimicrobiales bacterium]|jgi:subtilisin family serine protease|nr:S8 family serine peptidase [Acidimicrobiales bacterium]